MFTHRIRAFLGAAFLVTLGAMAAATTARAAVVSITSSTAALLGAKPLDAPGAPATPIAPDSLRIGSYLQFRVDPPPCAGDSVRVVISDLCPACVVITGFELNSAAYSTLKLEAGSAASCMAASCFPLESAYALPPRPAGPGEAFITVSATVPVDSLHPSGEVVFHRTVAFVVSDTCGTPPPPPPPGTLPYVTAVTIVGATAACDTCMPHVCQGQPVSVHVVGQLPTPCYSFLGARILPSMNPTNRELVELDFRNACYAPCAAVPVPFEATIDLPAAALGPHTFELRVAINTCPDTTIGLVAAQSYAYVADSCGITPPPTCIWPFLEPTSASRDSFQACDLVLAPGDAGPLVFGVHTTNIPLAGLQGLLGATPNLRILRLEPVGVAQGMHLVTNVRPDGGISFALFADAGAPIPAQGLWPVLRAYVKVDSSALPGTMEYAGGEYTAASDSAGTSIGICPVMTFVSVQARVCIVRRPDCDVNGDGLTNVADLVRMARCWFHPGSCPDSSAGPDCNGDGAFTVRDILCCARVILGGGTSDSLHAAPGLHVELGTPVFDGARIRVPLVIRGATAMNGALLHLTFPGERFQLIPPPAPALGAASAAATWLPLVEPGNGDAVIGVLRLDDAATDVVTVPLEFALLPGQQPGGVVTIDQGDLIAPDGSGLSVDLSRTATPMPTDVPNGGPVSRVDLLCGPNPANGSTQFVVRLPVGAFVDLAVYDLAGRRVETLWHGSLASGETRFAWQPGGGRTGLFFARLSVNGVVRTTRVTMQLAR